VRSIIVPVLAGAIGITGALNGNPNNSSHVLPGAIYALQYDLLNDFEPVALLSTGPSVLTARKAMPANDLKSLIAWRNQRFEVDHHAKTNRLTRHSKIQQAVFRAPPYIHFARWMLAR
jgi:hypothetical protein